MQRKPPARVIKELRREVGFGCPIPGCGNPYLYWHHFHPTWGEQQHHNPEGMIALCGTHHAKADAGAYTKEQLQEFKKRGADNARELIGRFEWMRRNLLAVVGGNFYYQTPTIFEFKGEPSIWFEHDEDGYFLLNIRMLSTSREPRMRIENNFWISRGSPDDLESPPSGKSLRIKYSNGDALAVCFFELESVQVLQARYPFANPVDWEIDFPVTAVEVNTKVGGTNVEFGPLHTKLSGGIISGGFFKNGRVGLAIG